MKRILFSLILISGFSNVLYGQMQEGQDVLYGNEWIDYDRPYFKVKTGQDGIYRIPRAALLNAGIPVDVLTGDQYQLFHLGKEVPIYTSTNAIFGSEDFIEFYGEQNRSQIDRYLFEGGESDILNPLYSLVNDTSAYFLTWNEPGVSNLRYASIENDLTDLPGKEVWYWHEETLSFTERLAKKANSQGVRNSHFQKGEGYSNNFKKRHNIAFKTDHAYLSATDSARLQFQMAVNERPHELSIRINNQDRITENFYGYALKKYDLGVMLGSESETINLTTEGAASNNDRQAIGYASLKYPRTFHMNGEAFAFTISRSSSGRYLEIEQFEAGNEPPVLYRLDGRQRLTANVANGITRIKLPPSVIDYRLFLSSVNAIQTIESVSPVNFTNYDEQEAEYIILSNTALFDDGNGRNLVQEYADYRSSAEGGAFTTVIVDVEQLYDQFAYGIDRHYIAIRNFGHYIRQDWANPRYFFILGKAIETDQMRTANKVAEYEDQLFYVPTFGNPGADNLLLSDNTTSTPVIPLGRLAASTPAEIEIYLDKVKAFDANRNLPQTIEDKYWMKRILHLGGGDPTIQGTIRRNLEDLEEVIENSAFGGDVTAFYKESTDAIEVTLADDLFDIINNGLSVITFYGHSGTNSFDFSLDKPENYENKDKYPIFISLGCYSGQIHAPSRGVSESFVFARDRGTMAFFASTGLGYVSSLRIASNFFYEAMGDSNYGEGLGDIMQTTLNAMDFKNSLGVDELAAQYTLHGDPAIVLNAHDGPDFTIDQSSVAFSPKIVDLSLDSFDIQFDVLNLGKQSTEPLNIRITQELPNKETIMLIDTMLEATLSDNQFSFRIPTLGKSSVGLNYFSIEADVNNNIPEVPLPQAEMNNSLLATEGKGIPLFIIDNSIQPIYPVNYSIVNEETITLSASTTNALAPDQDYVFEIDTTSLFNSPFKQRTIQTQIGGLLQWTPDIIPIDNTVYYWRVSLDSTDTAIGYNWEERSFVYLPGESKGWNHSHYFQFLEGRKDELTITAEREFQFEADGFFITMYLRNLSNEGVPSYVFNFGGPASSVAPWNYMDEGFGIVVGDALDGVGWVNPSGGDYGSVNPNRNTRVFAFPTKTKESRKALIDFLTQVIPDNSFVYAFTILNSIDSKLYQEEWAQDSIDWGTNIYSVFEEEGAQLIRGLADGGPFHYGFFYKKGDRVLTEGISTSLEEELKVESFIPVPGIFGRYETPPAGPAKSWDSFSFEINGLSENDQFLAKIYSLQNGEKTLLIDSIRTKRYDLGEVDASENTQLVGVVEFYDEVDRTAPDIEFIRFSYQEKPELAVNPAAHFTISGDTIAQGSSFELSYNVTSLNKVPFDSILISYTTINADNVQMETRILESPLEGLGQTTFEFEFEEQNFLPGINQINVNVNPEEAQPEITLANNFVNIPFTVAKDITNPILDVTFDGIRIQDGDIVSPKTEIHISLTDENPNLPIQDTSSFRIFLTHPDGQITPVRFNQQNVNFIPASGDDKNQAAVLFYPELEMDGTYELTVQGWDASRNISGDYAYQQSFKVFNENMISNVLNYPNPFSTSTRFVYTLTGEQPAFFKIQIMTVSGRIVKEIGMDELGPLKIGTHITDYQWDGRDEYGDRLANGVYLYRVVAQDATGKAFENFDEKLGTGTNQFFKQNLGKMVILR